MSIAAYMVLFRDDTDIAVNAIASVAQFVDEVLVIDTGEAELCHHPNPNAMAVSEFCESMCDVGYPVVYTSINWGIGGNYSLVRNRAGQMLSSHDWIYMIDADEMVTNELAEAIAAQAPTLPLEVVTVAPSWLTLYPDESHYSAYYSHVLSHGRLYRPDRVTWVNSWHEHQNYQG